MTNKKTTEGKGFWETLVGPNKEDVWRELSGQIYSRIEQGGWLESDKMHLDVGNWTITLDDYRKQRQVIHKVHTLQSAIQIELRLSILHPTA